MIGPRTRVSSTAPGKQETPREQGFRGDGASRARTGDLLHAMQIRPKPAYLCVTETACNPGAFLGGVVTRFRSLRTGVFGRLGHDWATA